MVSRGTSVEGLRGLDQAFQQLTRATARNVARRSLKAGGQIIADKASDLAPDDPRTAAPDLRTSITVSTKLKNPAGKREFAAEIKKSGSVSSAVSALTKARSKTKGAAPVVMMFVGPAGDPARYAHFPEFGTVNHAPQPYMTPAFESEKMNALRAIEGSLKTEMNKAIARAARKAAKMRGK